MLYYRLCKSKYDHGIFIPETANIKTIINESDEWFLSAGKYTEEHKKVFDVAKSVAGFTNVEFNELYFDFDGKFEDSKRDALKLCTRLIEQDVPQNSVGIYFSGRKGFHVVVRLNKTYSIKRIRATAFDLASDLNTFDTQVYNDNRIFRVVGSKHQGSGLFKTEITYAMLKDCTPEMMNKMASNSTSASAKTPSSLQIKEVKEESKEIINKTPTSIQWELKPKFLSKARFALQEGFFESGERNTAFLCLAATYKNLGFQLEHTYRILKGVASLQAQRMGGERYPDEELYNNVCLTVYSSTWRGGQFSEREEGNWLNLYAKRIGVFEEAHKEDLSVNTTQAFGLFKSYAKNYKNNIIYSGIPELDKHCKFLVGTSNAIVAAPGTGKSSLMLEMLNHNSLQGVPSVCFSLDMFHALLSMRLAQKHTGLSQDEIYALAEKEGPEFKKLESLIQKNYENVRFNFRAGIGIDEIVETINDAQEQMGKKIKLVYIDYSELVVSEKSDPTAASADVMQSLRRIANELEVCVVVLLQPSKLFSQPAEEITTFNAAKGSSAIAQSLTLMLGISRPGFNPLNPENDNYMSIVCLKNRNGSLFSIDQRWEGLTGKISRLEDEDREILFNLRQKRDAEKAAKGSWQ